FRLRKWFSDSIDFERELHCNVPYFQILIALHAHPKGPLSRWDNSADHDPIGHQKPSGETFSRLPPPASRPPQLSSPSRFTSATYRGSFLIGSSRGCTRSRSRPEARSSTAISSQRNASSTSPRLACNAAIPHAETTRVD